VAAALLAATSSTRAQTNWTGAVSSDWFNPLNWSAGVPTAATSANINTVSPNPTGTVVAPPGGPASALNLSVGQNGTGRLTIQSGGTVTDVLGTVGNLPGSQGTVTVTGVGSTWTNQVVVVGGLGTGTLAIQNGGTVNSAGGGSVGVSPGSTGTVTVTGPGSSWNNGPGGGLNIGSFGTGTLTIANGGTVINTGFTANVGNGPGSQGTVTVTGAGSTWSNSSGVNIGNFGTGTLTIADSGIVTGPVVIATNAGSTGTLNIGAGAGDPGTLNAASVAFGAGAGTLNFNHTSTNYTFAPAINGNGTVNVLAGTTILTADNTYTGATNVNGGALIVNGSIASSSVTTVNSGAALLGSGIVGTTQVNAGGSLVPGPVGTPGTITPGTMTVTGNLAFLTGAFYVVQVNPTTASTTNVNLTASLAGTVAAVFAPGTTYVSRPYTILTAAGGVTGTFDALSTFGLPAGFGARLSYTGNTALLNLRAQLVPEPEPLPPTPTTPFPTVPGVPGLPLPPEQQSSPPLPTFTVNELNVGHAIDNFFNNGGALPPAFVSLFNLTGNNLTTALDQLSGEAATGAQKVAFQLTDQFLNLMLDPFVDGRSGVGGADHPALGFAPERDNTPPDISLAYASVLKGPRVPAPLYEPRWTVWGGAYGGSNRTSGDVAIIGSHDLSARTVGFAGGFDYRLTPDTVVGIAFAGGGTNWSLSQGLGGGKSDAFQAGIYGATKYGPAYLAAAFAFANHWMSTDRLAVGDHLTANFDAQSYGGRLEGGCRFATPYLGITPYAAIQAQSFHTPGYTETGLIPNGFALNFDSRHATDTRSELGARFDRVLAVYSNAVLALRGRVAWAHDWVSDPTLTPLFQALPGASFIVNGALLPQNAALTSAGGELRFGNGITLLAKFDGEFASHSSTYGGTGTFRYRW
jgi:T5SS/PEP-CTERM-associated repeat protein/autotransporter-associated beta strand protein